MRIEFDSVKNQANVSSRGLSFERVTEFDFATAVMALDTRKDYPEPRWVAMGFLGERLHVLCFTPVTGGIRVISFRKANAREVRIYDHQTQTPDR